ncbi:MAG: N-acetylmuramoyl-L-alanine amidase [Clostridiales bacterium]|nr:N-acetylmuramoyl-L-alanine amidase [Clostridiales bacterium]
MSKKVCLDCGHGGSDPGAVNGARTEKADVLRIGLKVRDLLTAQGINVVLTRTADKDVSINERCKIANGAKCDYFLSIHRNAASPDASGNEIWVHSKAVAHVVDKAQKILNAVCAAAGKNRGVKKGAAGNYTDYGVNRDTDMPSALLELGFITSAEDNKTFDANFDAYAKAIAKGVCAALGEDYKESQPVPVKPSTGGSTGAIAVGSTVKVIGTKYATGQTIPAWVKSTTHKVSEIKGDRALLGRDGGICSWVYLRDLTLVSGGAAKPVEVGCKVTINKGAVYGGLTSARGSKVPLAQLAPKKHTVSKIQANKGVKEALLKEIMSWVAVSSLTRA